MKKPLLSGAVAVLFAAALFLSTGCAAISPDAVKLSAADAPAAGAYVEVPFYPQKEFMCGPAALAGVLGYWGANTAVEDVAKAVYNDSLKGALSIDLVIYAREKGFEADFYKGGMEDLKKNIRSGVPPILFIDAGYALFSRGHYIVATGYSDGIGAVTAHSGQTPDAVYTYGELEKAWQKTNYSTILIRPGAAR